MKARLTTVLALALATFGLAFLALFLILAPGVGRISEASFDTGNWLDELPYLVVMIATVLVGAVIAAKRPRNPIGWLLALLGLGFAAYPVVVVVAASALAGGGDVSLPVYLVAWVGNWVWVLGHAGALFVLLLFPNGRLLSRRLRPLALLAAALLLALFFVAATFPGPLEAAPRLENPFTLPIPEPVIAVLIYGTIPLEILACGLLVVRFWRARGEERQQMKWVALGAAVLASSFLLNLAGLTLPGWADALGSAVLISAIAIAVLRYRLYDIDVIINRALVYGTLTVTLAAVYVGGVAILQYAFRILTGGESTLVIVASTLAIAALFSPMRRGIQAFIDRRFYRRKYDAARTLEAFGARLRDEVDLESLTGDLVGTARVTVQPAHVSLWLRDPASDRAPRTNE